LKPYYDHNGITIYHGDCTSVRTAVLADVPYFDHLRSREAYAVGFVPKARYEAASLGIAAIYGVGEVLYVLWK